MVTAMEVAGDLDYDCYGNGWFCFSHGGRKRILLGTDTDLGSAFCSHALVCLVAYWSRLASDHTRNLAYQFILLLPFTSTLVPIAVPTLYLWLVDTLALRRGTWTIEPGTKLGRHIWDGLEIEYEDLRTIIGHKANLSLEKQLSSWPQMY